MTGPGGQRLRTRTGEQVKLASLIDEAVERAANVIADRYDDAAQRSQIAEAVGIGALKYGDLSVARDSGYVLDFDRLLALTGNTGPYLQYATARIRSIFGRAGLAPEDATGPVQLGSEAERTLALPPARLRAGSVRCRSDGGAPQARRVPFRRGERLYQLLRAVPGARCRGRGQAQQASPVRPDPSSADDRPGPARHRSS